MPEHRIRLRGGWFLVDPSNPDAPPRRLTLPLASHPDPGRPVVLLRPFQRPPTDPARETLGLRLVSVPGLVEARLNDLPLTLVPMGTDGFRSVLGGDLPARNRLVLRVGPDAPTDGPGWGDVALVIRGRDMPPGGTGGRGLQ